MFEEMSDDEMMTAVSASTPDTLSLQSRSPSATQNVDVHQNVSGEESLTQLPLGTMRSLWGRTEIEVLSREQHGR